jgi:5-enolpyruvylshikimate-3-phosphate synthase
MLYTVHKPEILKADIQLPASKSISNRVLILQALSNSAYDTENMSDSDDTQVMMQALTNPQNIIDVKTAGTSMRFLTAYFATQTGEHVITGTDRMTQCLMEIFGVKTTRADSIISIPPQSYRPVPYTVESDWSAASYWYEMLSLSKEGSEITSKSYPSYWKDLKKAGFTIEERP